MTEDASCLKQPGVGRARRLAAVAAAVVAVGVAPALTTDAAASAPVSVVVMAGPGATGTAETALIGLGGHVTRPLGVINGFAADIPGSAVGSLAAVPGVTSVTPDRPMRPLSIVPALGYDPSTDLGSMSQVSQFVGAQSAWAAGLTGQGVDVAVIDTGITPVPGLDAPGKVINGPDLSFDEGTPAMTSLDAYGHGTFMASLIAGRDDTASTSVAGCSTCLNTSGYSDTTKFVGIAPDARLINVKVGAADGSADVSQVIAAIDWVTQHAHDPGLNIRVLNLSFGTQSGQDWTLDPLAYAADQAWRHGIVVVASAGNDGAAAVDQNGNPLTLADPAYDPNVLAVGAVDLATAAIPTFAQHGTSQRPVDVVTPGTHIIGLRVPGSFIDTLATNTGQVGSRFQRGSGTSESAAIASGLVALLAQEYPTATPDQLKDLIDKSATTKMPKAAALSLALRQVAKDKVSYAGNGMMFFDPSHKLKQHTGSLAAATGKGTLEASRGGVYVADTGVNLTGEQDSFGHPFSSSAMAILEASATSWTAGVWNGNRWTGDSWAGNRWSTAAWTASDWAGNRWTGNRWSGMAWDGNRWTGSGWAGNRWTGTTWSGNRWSTYSST